MELRVLRYFLALAREGSVSAAAEALHVSQPTLSRQLIGLERELGTTLFERGRQGVTLTEDGLLLRRRASEITDLVRITESEIQLNRGVVAGEIRIGCAETQAMDLLARVMEGMRREHPQVTFRVSSDIAENVVEQIEHGLLDFGLLLRVRERWNLRYLQLPTNERAVVLLRADDPLAARPRLRMDDLVAHPLLVPVSWGESDLLGGERPAAEGGRLTVAAQFDLPYNASRMVRAGLGAAVLLAGLVEDIPHSGLVVRPLDTPLDMPSYLAWKPFQLRTRACEDLLARMRATYAAPKA